MIKIKRIYDPPEKGDGFRIFIDRLWARGLKKEEAKLDLWLKDLGPSDELRKWFSHDPAKWEEFKKRFFEELDAKQKSINTIREKEKHGTVTLLFGSKEERFNNAVAMLEYLKKKPRRKARAA